MWDLHDSQGGGIHGEGLQNRTESQVGKDQVGGESEQGERGERTDGSEMEGEEQNEKRRQAPAVKHQPFKNAIAELLQMTRTSLRRLKQGITAAIKDQQGMSRFQT